MEPRWEVCRGCGDWRWCYGYEVLSPLYGATARYWWCGRHTTDEIAAALLSGGQPEEGWRVAPAQEVA